MKSDKKRPDREKTNKEKSSRENMKKTDKEKTDREEADREKTDREKSDEEKLNSEKLNSEKLSAEKVDTEKAAVESGSEKAAEAAETVKPEKAGNTAEKADDTAETSGTEKADDTAEASGTEKAGSTAEAGGTEKSDDTAEAGGTEKSDSPAEAGKTEKEDGQGKKSKKRGIAWDKSRKHDEQEEEGEDWENDDDPQDDWEEESEPSKPWVMALVFFGLVLAAAVICVMLWFFTHPDKPEEEKQNALAGATTAPDGGETLSPSQEPPSGTGNQPLENQGGDSVPGQNPGESDAQASNLNRVTTQDGRVIIFTDCDEMVTPKEYVNLRTEPSTSQGEATVGCTLNHGETAHRTGISEEMGWSRVEYNDQILYVVSSFVTVVTDGQLAE